MVPGTTFEQVALEAMGLVADKRKTLKIKKGEV
jgi:hypothetical protein